MTRKITFRFAGPSLFALALAMPRAMSPIAAPPAHALFGIGGGPFIVYDPTNHAENLLTAARALEQINNQIAQLQNEAQMLINQARNLANLPYSALQQIQQNVSRTQQLLAQAQNIAFDVQSIDQMFQQDYGNLSLTATDQQLIAEARSRWENTVGGLQDAMRVQAGVVGNINANRAEMSALVGQSQNAVGALQATQAGNQLLALQSQQLSDLIAVISANGRANALTEAERATAAEQGRIQRERFLTPARQRANVQLRPGGETMEGKVPARIAAIVFVAIAITATVIEMTREEAPVPASTAPALQPSTDPLRATLRRCQQLGVAASSDADCLAVWAESRDRFLGRMPAPEAPQRSGGQ